MSLPLPTPGAGALAADTKGGQQVLISGSSFGPPSFNAVDRVTYGRTGVEFNATGCVVQSDSNLQGSQMSCVTSAGTGASLVWLVTIGGQTSAPWGFTAYSPPSVSSFDGPGANLASTSGLQTVRWSRRVPSRTP